MESLFWNVFKNKFLFSKILEIIHKTEWVEFIGCDRRKFSDILSLNWMIGNKQYHLLKCKLNANEYIYICKHTPFSIPFLSQDNEEIFHLLLEKKRDEMGRFDLLKLAVGTNSIKTLEILVNEPYNYQISQSILEYALSNSSIEMLSFFLKLPALKITEDFKKNSLKFVISNLTTHKSISVLALLLDHPKLYELPSPLPLSLETQHNYLQQNYNNQANRKRRKKEPETTNSNIGIVYNNDDWKLKINIETFDKLADPINKLIETGCFKFESRFSYSNLITSSNSVKKLICFLKINGETSLDKINEIINNNNYKMEFDNANSGVGGDESYNKLYKQLLQQLIIDSKNTNKNYNKMFISIYINKFDEIFDEILEDGFDQTIIFQYCIDTFSSNIFNSIIKNKKIEIYITSKKQNLFSNTSTKQLSRLFEFVKIYTANTEKYQCKLWNQTLSKNIRFLNQNQYEISKSLLKDLCGYIYYPQKRLRQQHKSNDKEEKKTGEQFLISILNGNFKLLESKLESILSLFTIEQLSNCLNYLNENDLFSNFKSKSFIKLIDEFLKCFDKFSNEKSKVTTSLASLDIKLKLKSFPENTIKLLFHLILFDDYYFGDLFFSESILNHPDNIQFIFDNFDFDTIFMDNGKYLKSIISQREVINIGFTICSRNRPTNQIETTFKFIDLFFGGVYFSKYYKENSAIVTKFTNDLYDRFIQIKNISKEQLFKFYNILVKKYSFPIEHTLYHSFYYLNIKSPKLVCYIFKRPGIDRYIWKLGVFFDSNNLCDPETINFDGHDEEGLFKIESYLNPDVFTFDFIFNNSFDTVLGQLITSLSHEPIDELLFYDLSNVNTDHLSDKLNQDLEFCLSIKRNDLFFKQLEFIQSLLDIDFNVGSFPSKVYTNLYSSSILYLHGDSNSDGSSFSIGPFKYFKISKFIISNALRFFNEIDFAEFIQFNKHYPKFIEKMIKNIRVSNYCDGQIVYDFGDSIFSNLEYIFNNYNTSPINFNNLFKNNNYLISNDYKQLRSKSLLQFGTVKSCNHKIHSLISSIINTILSKSNNQIIYNQFLNSNDSNIKINKELFGLLFKNEEIIKTIKDIFHTTSIKKLENYILKLIASIDKDQNIFCESKIQYIFKNSFEDNNLKMCQFLFKSFPNLIKITKELISNNINPNLNYYSLETVKYFYQNSNLIKGDSELLHHLNQLLYDNHKKYSCDWI